MFRKASAGNVKTIMRNILNLANLFEHIGADALFNIPRVVVLVVVAGDDANDVRRTLAFYDSAAQRPQACIALPRSAT